MSNSAPADSQKRFAKSRRKQKLCIAAAVAVFLCVVLSLMVTCRPKAYRPVSPAGPEQVSPYLTHELGPDIYNNIQLDEPFRVLVTQEGINDIIARWEWPYVAGSAIISTPVVVFEQDTLTLMAGVKLAKIPMVVTVKLMPELDQAGLLRLNLDRVTAGLLNITTLARTITAAAIENELEYAGEDYNMQWLKDLRDALLENKPYDPVFPVYDDSIRVSEVELVDGRLTLLFTPVKQQ